MRRTDRWPIAPKKFGRPARLRVRSLPVTFFGPEWTLCPSHEEQTVTPDRSSIEAVVQTYFDGLYEGDADKLAAAFHPSADLRWVDKGELKILTVPDWLAWVRKRPSAKAEGKPREDFVVTIDRSDDNTAFIKVRCQLPPRYFTDYLVAMKLADGWQIVSKSYRYDLRE